MDARQFAAGMKTLATHEDEAVEAGRLRGERRRNARRRLDFAAYESVVERNAELAAACGACACFGQPHCPDCGGEGKPGWQMPDASLFRMYVAPVLERLGAPLDEEEPHHRPSSSWAHESASL
ncbi:hypothetical protein NR798_00665 [Archangium gephyra]|uniref:hypothetical protein n=1 Tax=Archangium gephyra TaxID=48 RepID=UPI0035D44322